MNWFVPASRFSEDVIVEMKADKDLFAFIYGDSPSQREARRKRWREDSAKYRKNNPVRYRDYVRAYYARNRERAIATSVKAGRKWRKKPEVVLRVREYALRWARNNPTKRADKQALRKARQAKVAIEKIDRLVIAERDEWRCRYCFVALTPKTLTLDHVVALSRGGSHTYANLVAACGWCNSSKHDTPVIEWLWRSW